MRSRIDPFSSICTAIQEMRLKRRFPSIASDLVRTRLDGIAIRAAARRSCAGSKRWC
jgi:hypothetical protein